MTDRQMRNALIQSAREMLATGLVQGTGGNFSLRCKEGLIITPSGMEYNTLTPEDLPKLALDGRVLEGRRAPSVENGLHRAIYRARRDVLAVVHTHSVCASAASALRRPLPALLDNQAVLFGGAVPCAEYAPIGTPQLAENVLAALGDGSAVLLANHGAVCVGATLKEAESRCFMLELFSKVFFLTAGAGGAVALTETEARREAEDMARRYGQPKQ